MTNTLKNIAFACALCLSILSQQYLLWAKLGWLVLIVICGMNTHFAISAVFFFAAFFIPAAFPGRLFFTVKHFHITSAILVVSLLLKGNLISRVRNNFKFTLVFIPWLVILCISFFSAILNQQPQTALSMTANVSSLVVGFSLLTCILDGERKVVVDALLFFGFGVCIRIALAATKSFFGWPPYLLAEPLIHSTHIGFLASSSLFLLLPFVLVKQETKNQIISFFMLIIISMGLFLSMSRTAWFSALISYFLFCILIFWLRQTNGLRELRIRIKWFIISVSAFFFILLFLATFLNQEMMDRLAALQTFFEPDYWQYALQDRQNFGPFGFFRLVQFSTIGGIFRHNFLFGIGLSREVTDFHCLYLTLLGGTGFVGLVLFLSFCFLWIKWLLHEMFQSKDELNLFRVGVLCTFSVWLITSFMETFIIQFNVWIVITIGIVLSKNLKRRLSIE